jgi:predicted component of type VI protein secretion system
MELLNKGLTYNLHRKPKNWLQTLAMQVETGIQQLPAKEQNYMRQLVTNNLQKLINTEKSEKERNSRKITKNENGTT